MYKAINQEIKKSIKKAKESWVDVQCQDIEDNIRKNDSKKAYQLVKTLTSTEQGKPNTVQDKDGNCLTETNDNLNRWTEYCAELYSHTVVGDPEVLTVPLVTNTDNYPILREKVEAAVKSLKKGKSPGIDNIPGELVCIKSAIRFGRQESGQCHGPSLLSSPFPRKATFNSARTTAQSALYATQVKSC